jgi:Subtilase family/Putative binding domain, N-terminal/Viral BACON domain
MRGSFGVAAGLLAMMIAMGAASAAAQDAERPVESSVLEALARGDPQDVLVVVQFDGVHDSVRSMQEARIGTAEIGRLEREALAVTKARALGASGVGVLRDYRHLPLVHVRLRTAEELALLLASGEVLSVRRPRRYLPTLSQSLPLIRQPEVQGTGATGSGTWVAVLDTGLDHTLAPDVFGPCNDRQAAGCKVPLAVDVVSDDGQLDAHEHKHGTNVAAIVLGVAPGTRIAAVDVFPASGATDDVIAAGIDWVLEQNATYNFVALNLSLGSNNPCTPNTALDVALRTARNHGIVPVIASGNDARTDGISDPACYASAVSVGAVYDELMFSQSWCTNGDCEDPATAETCIDWFPSTDEVPCFSNTSPGLTLLAPGAKITAGSRTLGGTSQAAPHVAGAFAVLRALYPSESVDQLTNRMTSTGTPVRDRRDGIDLTKARLDLFAAVNAPSTSIDAVLEARPGGGTAPLAVTLTGRVDGGSGTSNFTFWWNCAGEIASVAQGIASCGDPRDPAVGAKLDTRQEQSVTVTTAPYVMPGTYHPRVFIERGLGAATVSSAVIVDAAGLGLSLTPMPASGTAPLDVAIKAAVAGGSGTIDYAIWWNCAASGTSVAALTAQCGTLPSPSAGQCLANATGYACSALSATTITTSTTSYVSTGTYRPRAVVARGGTSIARSATITVTANAGSVPSPSSPGTVSEPGTQLDTLVPVLAWNGVAGADAYGVYVSRYPYGEANLVYENEAVPGTALQWQLPAGTLVNGERYRWNLRAKSGSQWSSFSSRLYFATASCSYSVMPSKFTAGAGGTTYLPVSIGTASGCAWSWQTQVSWLAVYNNGCTSSGSSSGPASREICVLANPDAASRTGTITIGGQVITVVQGGTGCTYSVDASNRTFTPAGGSASIAVAGGAGCAWNAESQAAWITLTGSTAGSGTGTVAFTVAANSGESSRSGEIRVAGHTLTIQQGGAGCGYTVRPARVTVTAGGTTYVPLSIGTSTGCAVTWESHASWIGAYNNVCTSSGSSSGPQTRELCIVANPNAASRSGTITVAGTTVTVVQGGTGCSYTAEAANRTFLPAGGTSTVGVTASAGCDWNAESQADWITLQSTAGSGSGSVEFRVGVNTSASSRSGDIRVAGQTVTIHQGGAGCTYMVRPTKLTMTASGTYLPVSVTTSAGCTLTWESHASWLGAFNNVCASRGSSSGPQSREVCATANPDAASRTGTITLAGQLITVVQGGTGCTYAADPANRTFVPAGGSSTIAVTGGAGCEWNAESQVSWIGLTGAVAGSGNGTVAFSVAANDSGSSRSGDIRVAGQIVTIHQGGAGCTYVVRPTKLTMTASGTYLPVSVATSAGCTLTWESHASWLGAFNNVCASRGSSSGSQSREVCATANPDATSRSGTITLAGQLITVVQGGTGCTYATDPANRTFVAVGGSSTIAVTGGAGCQWNAESQSDWIALNGAASGSGAGEVQFQVAANASPSSRSGTILVAGRTITIVQGGTGCSYSMTPGQASVSAGVHYIPVTVTTAAGCSWTWEAHATWLSMYSNSCAGSGSASGPGTRDVCVAVNGGAARTGTITIAGQTFTVTQAGTSIAPPASLVASAVSSSQVALSWPPAAGAATYQIYRRANGTGEVLAGTVQSTSFVDTAVAPGVAYLYHVRAVDAESHISTPGPNDLATTIAFADDPLAAATPIRTTHVLQLRTAVDAVRALAGLSPGSYGAALTSGAVVMSSHVTLLRSSLDAARAALGLPPIAYTDPELMARGTVVKRVHVQQIRAGVQ